MAATVFTCAASPAGVDQRRARTREVLHAQEQLVMLDRGAQKQRLRLTLARLERRA